MRYNEIQKISDIEEKEQALIDFYVNEIKVTEWMEEATSTRVLFNDRIEIKKNGELHNLFGPAIIHKKIDNQYFIDGKNLEKSVWEKKSRQLIREIKLMKVLS